MFTKGSFSSGYFERYVNSKSDCLEFLLFFIFLGTNFRGLNKNDTFVGFKIHSKSIFLYNSYRKLPVRGYWNS